MFDIFTGFAILFDAKGDVCFTDEIDITRVFTIGDRLTREELSHCGKLLLV
jgi:hypothetical protein